jgi:RNA polymerase sigma-70 factor (ECF subfamily)
MLPMATPASGEPDGGEERLVRLMVEYQAGAIEAFEGLYAALARDLGRHFDAVSWGGATQDLVQETFLEMHRSRRTYLPPLPVRPWAYGIARNVLRRHRRTAWRRGRLEDPAAERALGADAPPVRPGVEARDVNEALRQIPEPRRHAWELHHVHGFSFEEIGRMLRIPTGAAKLRSSRAMGALRALLGVGEGRRDD